MTAKHRHDRIARRVLYVRIHPDVTEEARLVAVATNTTVSALTEEALRRQIDVVSAAHPRVAAALAGFRDPSFGQRDLPLVPVKGSAATAQRRRR